MGRGVGQIHRPALRYNARLGQVAQLVEQRTENPRVGGSIPPLATIIVRTTPYGLDGFKPINRAFVRSAGPIERNGKYGFHVHIVQTEAFDRP